MIIIFRGASGVGKSTAVEVLKGSSPEPLPFADVLHHLLARTALWSELGTIVTARLQRGPDIFEPAVFSADDYFTDEHGVYRFDPAKLSAAHGDCLYRFTKAIATERPASPAWQMLIVDNTHASIAEVAPYAALALAYGHELRILTLLCDPLTAWRRNQHDAPLTHVVKQDLILRQSILDWPAWWPQSIFPVGP